MTTHPLGLAALNLLYCGWDGVTGEELPPNPLEELLPNPLEELPPNVEEGPLPNPEELLEPKPLEPAAPGAAPGVELPPKPVALVLPAVGMG
jgi:hypothetical protein